MISDVDAARIRVEQPLLTRQEVADLLKISVREWDRLRKKVHFTEINVLGGHPKGLRFLGYEIEDYIRSLALKAS